MHDVSPASAGRKDRCQRASNKTTSTTYSKKVGLSLAGNLRKSAVVIVRTACRINTACGPALILFLANNMCPAFMFIYLLMHVSWKRSRFGVPRRSELHGSRPHVAEIGEG